MLNFQTAVDVSKKFREAQAEMKEVFTSVLQETTEEVSFSEVKSIEMLVDIKYPHKSEEGRMPFGGNKRLFRVETDACNFLIGRLICLDHDGDEWSSDVFKPIMPLEEQLILAKYIEKAELYDLSFDPEGEVQDIEEKIREEEKDKIMDSYLPAVKQAVSVVVEKVSSTLSAKEYSPYFSKEKKLEAALKKYYGQGIADAWSEYRVVLTKNPGLESELQNEVSVLDDFQKEISAP